MDRNQINEKTFLTGMAPPNPYMRCCTEPRRIKDLLKSPLHLTKRVGATSQKCSKIVIPEIKINKIESENVNHLAPRYTSELKLSPLHQKKENSKKGKTNAVDYIRQIPPKNRYQTRRKLEFNKTCEADIETRILAYARQHTVLRSIAICGIQNCNITDFVLLLDHLLAFTGALQTPLTKDNYIEQIILSMHSLKYPHELNPSWLKLPSSSIENILRMLDFLLDFVPKGNEVSETQRQVNKMIEAVEENYSLNTEFSKLENELLEQERINGTLELQLRQIKKQELDLQAQFDASQQQLKSVCQQNSQLEQDMARLCLEIWRAKSKRNELKDRLHQEASAYQSCCIIMEESKIEKRIRCTKLQYLAERTQNELQNNINAFNAFMSYLSNRYGQHIGSSSLTLPLTPTVAQIHDLKLELQELAKKVYQENT